MVEPIYDIERFAKRIEVGVSSAYRLVRRGEVKAARSGKLWRITESAVMEFLRGGEAGGTQSGTERRAA